MLDRVKELLAEMGDDDKRQVLAYLKDQLGRHKLEVEFGIDAERILDAISRGSDLTKRGVRGIIAETVFATEIVPGVTGWQAEFPAVDASYDVVMSRGNVRVRVQVKMQRKEKGVPLMRSMKHMGPRDHYVVEVQRTRNGKDKEGQKTRPYKFVEFDLLAVNMEASTKDWRSFLYVPVHGLTPRKDTPELIEVLQLVPPYPAIHSENWTTNLQQVLESVALA